MIRIECILRVLMADHKNASNFIADYRQLLPDGDFDTFKKVKPSLLVCLNKIDTTVFYGIESEN